MNVRGIGEKTKRRKIFHYLHEKKVDIACIQETHATKNRHRIWSAEWGGTIFFCDDTERSKGVAILFRKNLNIKHNDVQILRHSDGRFLSIKFEICNKSVCISNVYAPNQDSPEFFADILQQAVTTEADYNLIAGDFNVWLNPDNDYRSKSGTKINKSKSADVINAFIEQENWFDVWRFQNPCELYFMYKRTQPSLVMTRLDYILAPLDTTTNIEQCNILPAYLSDHNPVCFELVIYESIKGKGIWKLNTQHLKNPDFVNSVNRIIHECQKKDQPAIEKCENCKNEIRDFAKAFSTKFVQSNKIKHNQLENKISACHKKLAMINLKSDSAVRIIQKVNEKINLLKTELNKLVST